MNVQCIVVEVIRENDRLYRIFSQLGGSRASLPLLSLGEQYRDGVVKRMPAAYRRATIRLALPKLTSSPKSFLLTFRKLSI
jgi:hypothetical protein